MHSCIHTPFLNEFLNLVGDFIVSVRLMGKRGTSLPVVMPVVNILLYLAVDEHGHLKIYLPKKLLECLPKCTSLPKERHRWNTNEVRAYQTSETVCHCSQDTGQVCKT